jgi:hypothetical protein
MTKLKVCSYETSSIMANEIFKNCIIYLPNVGRSSFWKSIQLLIYLPNVGRSSFWKSIQLLN